MKLLPYLLPLTILIIRRHAAAAMLLDVIGGPVPRWQLSDLALLLIVELAVIVGGLCAAVLVWNYLTVERPLNKRKRP